MKLVEKYGMKGIHKHSEWIFEQGGRKIGINKNHDVYGANHYIFEGDKMHGEGCSTIWYSSLEKAKKEVQKLFNRGEKVKTGRDFGLCKKCACSYSHGTKDWKKYKEFVCAKKKEQYARGRR